MKETSKALRRRFKEVEINGIPWKDIFKGKGVDIGSGDDPIPFEGCQPFDMEHGDANKITKYLKPNTFDYVHASHVLEHMNDPRSAFNEWFQLLKPGGYIVGEVPSWELYEGRRDTSIYNPDHKSTWSYWSEKGGKVLPHFYAIDFFILCDPLHKYMEPVSVRLIDTNYDYIKGASVDQTFHEADGVECYIEFVLRKK